jgi:hypothetical protein
LVLTKDQKDFFYSILNSLHDITTDTHNVSTNLHNGRFFAADEQAQNCNVVAHMAKQKVTELVKSLQDSELW